MTLQEVLDFLGEKADEHDAMARELWRDGAYYAAGLLWHEVSVFSLIFLTGSRSVGVCPHEPRVIVQTDK